MGASAFRIVGLVLLSMLAWLGILGGLPMYDLRSASVARLIRTDEDVKRGKRLPYEVLAPTVAEQARGW